ncbi:MAG TPA: helix-turn-helix domain-containing protein, partial [Rugosimonospora sp.]
MARTLGSAAGETRQRIIDAARDLFVERGYAGTSVRDISERLGMTKGSMYYHFASKDELLHALVSPLVDEVDAFIADATAAGRVDAELIGRLVDLFDEQSAVLRQLLGDPSAA